MNSNTYSGILFNVVFFLALVLGSYFVALPAQAFVDGESIVCGIFGELNEQGLPLPPCEDEDNDGGEHGNPDFECADLVDNDGDGLIDFLPVLGDPDCEDIFDDSEGSEELICDEGEVLSEDETECIPDEDDGGGNGGGDDDDDNNGGGNGGDNDDDDDNNGRSSGGRNGRSGGGNRGGEVLGVRAPECSAANPFLNGYLRIGWMNDTTEVMKLQAFLNGHMDAGLPITGHFGSETFAAVEAFQVKYWEEVLLPWVPFGLPTEKTPTGFVYKTTSRWINMMACPGLELPMPELP